jgi:hypothetical protein
MRAFPFVEIEEICGYLMFLDIEKKPVIKNPRSSCYDDLLLAL